MAIGAYAEFKYGAVIYPIPAGTGGPALLDVCDPGVGAILGFTSACITNYLHGAVAAVSGGTPVKQAVGNALPIDPMAIAKHTPYKFPLLCAWRKSSVYGNLTKAFRKDVSRIGLAYILPPLDADDAVNTWPMLAAVGHIVDRSLFQAFDPNSSSGASVLLNAGVARAEVKSATYERFAFGDSMDFFAWVAEVEMVERAMPYSSDAVYDLNEITVDIADATVGPVTIDHAVDATVDTT